MIMKNVGIVAEYNPFHVGHGILLDKIKAKLEEDCTFICCMSGNFVQRGEPALWDKWQRAQLAVESGVNLVLELPTPWAAAGAQRFARGSVSLLKATGVADVLAFGSECGELAPLEQTAACLETEEFRAALREGLDRGLPFAQARQQAVRHCTGAASAVLSGPNDSLAVEYLAALKELNADMIPLAIRREGAGHDAVPERGTASASAIRALLRAGEGERAAAYLTPAGRAHLSEWEISDWERCERAALARLRVMTEEEFLSLPDCGEGLHRRLMAAVGQGRSLREIASLAKTKRYALARIRRAILWAALGLRADRQPELPPYLKVLAFDERGRALLARMKETAALPVLSRPADGKRWTGAAGDVLRQEARCTDLYDLTLPSVPPCGREWTTPPVFCRKEGKA